MTMRTYPSSFRGYTLVELIVSVAIFSIVMLIASAALLTLISLDRQARATNDVVTNLSYVVDSMSRSLRTGTDYKCNGGGDCANGTSLTFTDYQGQTITYLLTGGRVGQCVNVACSASNAVGLTDPRITVDTLTFNVTGTIRGASPTGDGIQPRVLYTVSGFLRPDPRSQPVRFTIESSATQRLIDI